MTQVDFHFNAPEKMPYVCRLLRKASGQGRKVGVLADQDTCHLLSQALWNLNATHQIFSSLELWAQIRNIEDKRYSDSASSSTQNSYTPGAPRSYMVGLTWSMK
jgi:outer membrane receptor for ferrienterochelin and colicin